MESHREPTLADVAQAAGVSLTTVSRVLNNRGYLSQETRERVAEAIAQLNYRPNQIARALHGKSTHSIGLIVPTVALPFFGELTEHVEDFLAERGYRTFVCNSMGKADREREYLDLLVSHRVDGIISSAHNDGLADYSSIHLPLVSVDRDLSPIVPNVRCDNEAGGRLAAEQAGGAPSGPADVSHWNPQPAGEGVPPGAPAGRYRPGGPDRRLQHPQ